MGLRAVALEDRYEAARGEVLLTGTQAIVRLLLLQKQCDARAGLNTGGFVSGYRGSPLGGVDRALWQAQRYLDAAGIVFQPGINEDLAATAIWGSQQVALQPDAKVDGVFGLWYGKGPGVDRTGDVFKHAQHAGTSRFGGVLALAGDDHACKSSTLAHGSEYALADAAMPVLAPSSIQEVIDFGLYGWALSRATGLWIALKLTADTADGSGLADIDPGRHDFAWLGESTHGEKVHICWPDPPLVQETRLLTHKIPLCGQFHRDAAFDHQMGQNATDVVGIIGAGRAFNDLRQALDDLGIDAAKARALGLRVYKPAMVWPLEPAGLRRFADGLQRILVVEDKRPFIELQTKEILYGSMTCPEVLGKRDNLLPASGELEPGLIARAIVSLLGARADAQARAHVAWLDARRAQLADDPVAAARMPYFCSGCPHNTSTKIPENSRAMAGIGCHYLVITMDRRTETYSHMGGEGAAWIGQAPFVDGDHVFVNMGDGTYVHSGLLAIRAAVASGVTMTYKILHNDAVAMTGGQAPEGQPSPQAIAAQLLAEGVRDVRIVSDEPEQFQTVSPPVRVHHRDELDTVQRTLRDTAGVTAIVYAQPCATEKRRRRKRGLLDDPDVRVVINEAVCEGCGDCSVQSNCLSIEPVETEFGRKRRINQSTCNKDLSCLKGFCPSFVTVRGGRLRRPKDADDGAPWLLPEPELPTISNDYGILITGIGGTGVVTLSALLTMAAHLEGKAVVALDQAGLAQKYGAVISHVRIAERPDALHAPRVGPGGCDLLLGGDLMTAAGDEALWRVRAERTRALINADIAPTGAMVRARDAAAPETRLRQRLTGHLAADSAAFLDATRLASELLGDAVYANMLLLGAAWQRGLVPLSQAALMRAIELNGTAVAANTRAFTWGRRAVVHADAIDARLTPRATAPSSTPLEAQVETRVSFLEAYQNRRYAKHFADAVEAIRAREQALVPGSQALSHAVARNLFKLMAIKDEYEVARLYSDGRFAAAIAAQFEGEPTLEFHLAPPLMSAIDPNTGRPRKRAYGPWMMRIFKGLAGVRHLRGTLLDPFRYHGDRKLDRHLLSLYRADLAAINDMLTGDRYDAAVALATWPDAVRGFGPVRRAAADEALSGRTALRARFTGSEPTSQAA